MNFKRVLLLFVGVVLIGVYAEAAAASCTVTWADGTKEPCAGWWEEDPPPDDNEDDTPWWCFWCEEPEQECPERGSTCASCQAHCKCEYDKNREECDNNVQCLQIASLENQACIGNCLTDFMDC